MRLLHGDPVIRHLEYFMGTPAPPAAPPHPVRNTTSWSGTAYLSGQAWLISQLTLISRSRSPIRHVGTRQVGDGHPTAEVEAVWPRVGLLKFMLNLFCTSNIRGR